MYQLNIPLVFLENTTKITQRINKINNPKEITEKLKKKGNGKVTKQSPR